LPPKPARHTCLFFGIPSLFHARYALLGSFCRSLLSRHYSSHVFCSALPTSVVLWPLLTSDSSIAHYCAGCRFELLLHRLTVRPPRVRTIAFISCARCIYFKGFGQYWTLFCYANSSTPCQPNIQFLFIEPRLCLQLPSDSTSQWTPLLSANSSCCQAYSGLSPPSYRPCRAHVKSA